MGKQGYWGFPDMVSIVPAGICGTAEVKHLTLTESDAAKRSLQAISSGSIDDYESAGTYAKLYINNKIMMDDGFMERHSHAECYFHARGKVLVGGLGLGMVTCGLLSKAEVTEVTVLEKNPDVIQLIKPHVEAFSDKPLAIIEADVFAYQTDAVFDTVWMDIWGTRTTDNLREMEELRERYSATTYFGCWYETELRAIQKKQTECLLPIAHQLGISYDLALYLLQKDRDYLDSLVSTKTKGTKVLSYDDTGYVGLLDFEGQDQGAIVSLLFGNDGRALQRKHTHLNEQLQEIKEKASRFGFEHPIC